MTPLILAASQLINPAGDTQLADFNRGLNVPEPGFHELRVITPKVLELYLVNTQETPGPYNQATGQYAAPLTEPTFWNFHNPVTGNPTLPQTDDFEVRVNGAIASVSKTSFRRQADFLRFDHTHERDMRVGNSIFLVLAQAAPLDAKIEVGNGGGATFLKGQRFEAVASANRYNPAIHANQVGFAPTWSAPGSSVKKAHIGYFLGEMGELRVDGSLGVGPESGFEVINAATNQVVYAGTKLTLRKDAGLTAYQQVLEADFSELRTPGLYRLRVSGMGASLPFRIDENVPADWVRAFALGHYHQRSGVAKILPFTRFTDAADHTAPATMPFDTAQYQTTYRFMRGAFGNTFQEMSVDPSAFQHTAPQPRSADTLLFPYVGDVIAWWPMDGRRVFRSDEDVFGFNKPVYEGLTISDPFNGLPGVNGFGKGPARSALRMRLGDDIVIQQDRFGELEATPFQGAGFVNTYYLPPPTPAQVKDRTFFTDPLQPTGLAKTATFKIDTPYLTFQIGGGNKPYDPAKGGEQKDVVAVNLVVDGKVALTATGGGDPKLRWVEWDMAPYQQKSAHLELIDSSTTSYLMADEIAFTDLASVEDIASRRRHAKAAGTPATSKDGKLAGCLVFDGKDDLVRAQNMAEVTDLKQFTLSAWAKFDDLTRTQVLFSTAPEDEPSGFTIWFDRESKSLRARVGDVEVKSAAPINDNRWRFIALTYEAGKAGGLSLYLDHQKGGAGDTSSQQKLEFGQHPLVLGNNTNFPGSRYFKGCLDDVRLRASVVSAAELAEAATGSGPWIDVSGGHFDAGDYSKYMINSALMAHALTFAVDSVLQVSGAQGGPDPLDNLGVPESGDGICDLIQEAKWEADYIAKMQDTDGGFFFIAYPKERAYEGDVLPSQGDRQVVWPKSLAGTGSATAALAQLASSPAFKRHYPAVSEQYMAKALKGWEFIEAAVAKYGVGGAYQHLTHYGQEFQATDEIAWAAAALFAATGEPKYEKRLQEWLAFDPRKEFDLFLVGWKNLRRFTWQRLFEGVGAAMRAYAFANRGARAKSGVQFSTSPIYEGKTYLELVREEMLGLADEITRWTGEHPYGTSITEHNKTFGFVSYHFPESEAFDLLPGYLLTESKDRLKYFEAIISNVNYQLGNNPLNVSFISGLGWRPQRNYVCQYAYNDDRQLPPIGFSTGSINGGPNFLFGYERLPGQLTYPLYDYGKGSDKVNYPLYDRYMDHWHPGNEFTIPLHARGYATMAFLFSLGGAGGAKWEPAPKVTIKDLPASVKVGDTVQASVGWPEGADRSLAKVVWEAPNREPGTGDTYSYSPRVAGADWLELEVHWPDGRRSFARESLSVSASVDRFIEDYQPKVENPPEDFYERIIGQPDVRFYYPLDGDLKERKKAVPLFQTRPADQYDLELTGKAAFDPWLFTWPHYADTRPKATAIRLQGMGDAVRSKVEPPDDRETIVYAQNVIPQGTTWISVEAVIYIDGFNNKDQGFADILTLELPYRESRMLVYKDPYGGDLKAHFHPEAKFELPMGDIIPLQRWFHLRLYLDGKEGMVYLDGKKVGSREVNALADFTRKANSTFSVAARNYFGWIKDIIVKAGVPPEAKKPYQQWRQSLWKPLDLDNPSRGTHSADPDLDSTPNSLEYVFEHDPFKPEPNGVPTFEWLRDAGKPVGLRVRHPKVRPGLNFGLQHSRDLVSWTDYTPPTPPTETDNGDGTLTVAYSPLHEDLLKAPSYFRLAAALN